MESASVLNASSSTSPLFFPSFFSQRSPQLLPWISDLHLSLLAPVVCYWVFSLFFDFLSYLEIPAIEKHRLHTPAELISRNRATRWQVCRDVFLQHIIQTIIGGLFMLLDEEEIVDIAGDLAWYNRSLTALVASSATRALVAQVLYHIVVPAGKLAIAMFVVDTWQYFLHRLMHTSPYLYRTFHSRHHSLYVPYAYGALYNHPFEGFLLDSLGTAIAYKAAGMYIREAMVLFCFATFKTVDDHCGYKLPYDPFQQLFPNNSAYHDVHHQMFGIKANFSQPFFVCWDRWMGTMMSEERMKTYSDQLIREKEKGKENSERENKSETKVQGSVLPKTEEKNASDTISSTAEPIWLWGQAKSIMAVIFPSDK